MGEDEKNISNSDDILERLSNLPTSDEIQKRYEETEETQQPFYERGTINPNVGNILPAFAATIGSQEITKNPPTQITTSPELKSVQSGLENEQNVQSAARSAQQQQQDQYQQQFKEHQAKLAEAQARHNQIEAEHQAAISAQRKAMLDHAHAQTLTPEEEFERRQQAMRAQPKLQAPANEPSLKTIPVGGLGTYEYAIKSGATPEQAMRVPSMSAMQRQNIPELQHGYERSTGLTGGSLYNRYEGLPNLALTEEVAKDYLKPRMQAQEKIEERNAHEDAAKAKIQQEIARHKYQTEHALKVAELDLKEAKERLKESHRHMASHKAPESPKQSANEARENARQENKINSLEQRKAELQSELNRKAPRMNVGGFDEYTNTFPIGNGAGDLGYAHQLLQGIANEKMDASSKAIFQQELDKLFAKNPSGYVGNLNLAHRLLSEKANPNIDLETKEFVNRELVKMQKTHPKIIKSLSKIYLP